MKLVNLTPHTITLAIAGEYINLSSKGIARVNSTPGKLSYNDLVPVYEADVVGEVIDLPEPQTNTRYIVSGMVGTALKGTRDDILVPGTGPQDNALRNEKGHIIAITRLKKP
jgi:hypothetical protein